MRWFIAPIHHWKRCLRTFVESSMFTYDLMWIRIQVLYLISHIYKADSFIGIYWFSSTLLSIGIYWLAEKYTAHIVDNTFCPCQNERMFIVGKRFELKQNKHKGTKSSDNRLQQIYFPLNVAFIENCIFEWLYTYLACGLWLQGDPIWMTPISKQQIIY